MAMRSSARRHTRRRCLFQVRPLSGRTSCERSVTANLPAASRGSCASAIALNTHTRRAVRLDRPVPELSGAFREQPAPEIGDDL
jgi:hypothetical protein